MSDRVLIPLPGLGTLSLTREVYEAALIPLAAPAPASVSGNAIPGLLSAKAVAAALSLPESWIREKERQGEIPSTRAGRYVRFDLAAVRAALAKTTVYGSNGHS
jgi:excisionase family DNA binding protein